MSRPKKFKPAVLGRMTEIMRELPDNVPYRDLEKAVFSGKLPKERTEVNRLATVCTHCGEEGHWRKACPLRPCYLCGEPGHRQSRCPQRETT